MGINSFSNNIYKQGREIGSTPFPHLWKKKFSGSLFCGRIICGSPHLWEKITVGEDKNVGWEEKSVGGR